MKLVLLFWIYAAVAEKMGPFHTEIRTVGPCKISQKNENLIVIGSPAQKTRKGKNQVTFDLYLETNLTDQYKANVVLARKIPTGWKENFFLLDVGGFCSALKKFVPSTFRNLVREMKSTREDCPLPAGNYSNIALQPVVTVNSVPAFFYDTFRMRAMVFHHSRLIGCIEIIVTTKPY